MNRFLGRKVWQTFKSRAWKKNCTHGSRNWLLRKTRSVAQEVVFLIREHLAGRSRSSAKTSAEVLLELSGSWEDERNAEEIVSEIKAARRNSARLG